MPDLLGPNPCEGCEYSEWREPNGCGRYYRPKFDCHLLVAYRAVDKTLSTLKHGGVFGEYYGAKIYDRATKEDRSLGVKYGSRGHLIFIPEAQEC